jgi:hypothetical protein
MMVGPAIQHVQGRLSGISPKMLTRTLRQLEPASLLTSSPGLSMRWPNSARARLPAGDHLRLDYSRRDQSLSARRRSKNRLNCIFEPHRLRVARDHGAGCRSAVGASPAMAVMSCAKS